LGISLAENKRKQKEKGKRKEDKQNLRASVLQEAKVARSKTFNISVVNKQIAEEQESSSSSSDSEDESEEEKHSGNNNVKLCFLLLTTMFRFLS
jgi:hypothetical protein